MLDFVVGKYNYSLTHSLTHLLKKLLRHDKVPALLLHDSPGLPRVGVLLVGNNREVEHFPSLVVIPKASLRRAKQAQKCCKNVLMKHERTKRAKRIEWNNVSLVVDVAVCSHFARSPASMLVFLKLAHLDER